jgi:hypothetical protein
MPYPKPYQLHLIGGGPRHNLVLIHSLAGYSSQTAALVVCPRNTIYFNWFREPNSTSGLDHVSRWAARRQSTAGCIGPLTVSENDTS